MLSFGHTYNQYFEEEINGFTWCSKNYIVVYVLKSYFKSSTTSSNMSYSILVITIMLMSFQLTILGVCYMCCMCRHHGP